MSATHTPPGGGEHRMEVLKDKTGRAYGWGCTLCGETFTYAPARPPVDEAALDRAVERAREFLDDCDQRPLVHPDIGPRELTAAARLGTAQEIIVRLLDELDSQDDGS